MKKVYKGLVTSIFAILFSLNASQSWGQTTLFNDNFNANNSATFSTTGAIGTYPNWSVTRSGNDWGARVNTNILELTNDASATANVNGWVFGYRDINALSGWNTTLSSNTGTITWEFNMRQIRTDPAGFGSGSYGVAFVLAGTSATSATAGSGYAVVLGQSGSTDPIRLASYNNGLQGTLTNIITSNTTGLTDFGTNYLSVRVTYVPGTNTWQLFLRNDGTTAFTDPTSGTALTSQGTAVNNTYTSTAGMRYIGGYWQGSTAANQTAFFDNVYLKKTSSSFTVTFNANGGTGTMSNQTASAATNLTANAFTRTGYTFAGWATSAGGSVVYANSASYPFTANITLFAVWTPNNLTITYNTQGGSAISNGSTTTGGQIATSPSTPTRAGYTFNGWFTASSGGTAIAFPYTHNQTASFTLFAQWTANTLTITYNSQGGSAISNGSTTTGGSIATSPGTPTRAGYTFNGWFTASSGGTAISFPYTHNQTANFTLFAQWTANTLTITYDSQGGSAISNGSTTTGGQIAASPGTPTRAGYTFNGWFTASSGGTAISFPYTHNQTANFTLFAQWTANTLTVFFDSQGGSAISNGSTITGGTVANPGNPTQAGFTFDGWFVAASGGTAITFPYSHGQTANFTLFAQWTVAGSPTLSAATLSSTLSNVYGTASTGVSFTASGTFLTGNITVTAQTGYEVSTSSGSGYGASVSVASGTTVWVRFAALQNAGTYNNATAAALSSAGATPVNVLTSGSGNTVSPKPLSVTAPSIASKPYDGTATAGAVTVGTLSGFVGTQTVTATGAAANYSSPNANNYAGVVITYTLSNGTNGGLAANYSLANGSATGVVTPKALSITAPSIASKVYDATTTAGAVTVGTLSGLVGSETLTVTGAAANYSSANAGTYSGVVITYTLINGTGLAANYSLANGSATGVITPKSLTISPAPSIASKVYDATTTAGAVTVGSLSGFIGSQTVTVTGVAANYSSANAGTYTGVAITYTLSNGTNGGLAVNYSLANGSATGVITPKALTITAPSIASKAYDATTTAGAATVGTLSGFVGSQTVTATATAVNYSSAIVGTYTNVPVNYTLANGTNGGLAINYSLVAGTATGVITQRALTITANNVTKDAGTVITGGSGSTAFTPSGLQGGQTIGSVTIAYGAAAGSTGQGATPGTYTGQVTPSAATGGTFNAANYAITYASGSIIVVNYSLSPSAGSVAFTAFQASAPDGVEFITLRRLDLRQVTVTDNGILSTNAMRTGEGTYQFPNTSAYADIPAGTIIRLDEATGTDDTDFTEGVIHLRGNGSTVLGVGNFAISTAGDQVIMYTGSAATPSFIAGIAGADAVAAWDNVNGATSANTSKAPGTASDIYFSSSDNGYYNSSVTGNANAIRTSAITTGNWTTSGSAQAARFNNKTILFNESNFSAGSMSISGVTTTSMTIDVSGVSFTDESASATRYAVVIGAGAAPTAPVDRYTCYTGTLSDLIANFGTDPTVKSATTDVCAGTDGNGKVVYLGYAKPSALVINGLTGGTTYHIGVYAVNGNGRSANFSSTGLVQTQATTTPVPVVVLSSPNQVIADNVQPGTTNHIISHFEAATTVVNATLNQLQFTTSGTYAASELTGNFTLWYGTTNSFAGATSISTVASGTPGTYSFTGFSQGLNINTTRYFWITGNINAAANFPRTIQVGADPVLSFLSASQSGTISAGGIQTITPVIATVSTSAVSNISVNAADGGGNVTNDGASAVSARGVVWGTALNPTVPSANSTLDGTGTGSFTSNIISLNPQTEYFVRAYATNAVGTAYGSNISFFTLSNPVDIQANDLIANAISPNQVNLNWDPATFPSSGATVKGYVLLRAAGPAIPTFTSANGTAPVAGVGVIVTNSIFDPVNTFNNTGLSGNTTYNYLLIPYTWDGTNAETFNYLTTAALTAQATTPSVSCTKPTNQVTGASSGSVTTSSALISWTNGTGTGDRTIVIIKQGSAATSEPIDGIAYTGNNTFSNGDVMGPNEFVCYVGTAASFTVVGLAGSTTYHYSIYTFNNTGSCYLTPGATGSFTTLFSPSVIETCEPGTKNLYTNGNDVLALGEWNLNDALIGTSPTDDRKVGAKSVRIRNNGSITMLFNKTNGLGTVSIQHAKFGTDANSSWRMEVSNDGGATFTAYQSPVVTTNTIDINTTANFVVNIPGNNIRIRIIKLSGGTARLNLDQISLGNFISPNTINTGTITGSPFCISNAAGVNINVPFTSVGAYNEVNVYTAQLSDANGSFAIPTDVGTLASDLNTGTIAATIPAGTPTGSGYRIRIVSSSPVITGNQNSTNLSVFLNAPDVNGFFASISTSTSLSLGWTNPTGCFDQILIVGRAGSEVTAVPTGDGTLYTASAAFGGGVSGNNLPGGEFAIYKEAAGTSMTVSGLTTSTTYFFKLFTRKGTNWSDGVILSATPIAVNVGDYRSNGNGNYSLAAVWQTWNGSSWVAASSYPNSSGTAGSAGTVNVTIRNGHTIVLDASRTNQAIRNLTVESGARIWTQDSTYNFNRYMTIYGDISCLGNIGRGTNLYDNISFNIEGNPTTISGTGNFNASRLRKSFNTNMTTNLIIAMNMGLKFASGVGSSSGTVIYNNNSTSGNKFNVTINENTIVTLRTSIGESGNISIDGIDGEGSNERGGKVTVNGTLIIPGTLFALTNNLTDPIEYEIGTSGIIRCVNICTANEANFFLVNGSRAGGCNFTIRNGGRLEMTGGIASNPNTYNKPFSKRNNTLSPYTFVAGFGPVNNNFDLQPGSIVDYSSNSGTMPIQTQNLKYGNLLVTGAAVKTINSTLEVFGSITLEEPSVLVAGNNTIKLGGNWNSYGSAAFDEGTSTVLFEGVTGQRINASSTEDFYNLSVSNSTADGVELNCDVNVSNTLNLGTSGRLKFGPTPNTLALTNQTLTNTFLGGASSIFNMENAAHTLVLGCTAPAFSGTFNAGTLSTTIYNRSSAITLTDGDQTVQNLPYANLTLAGSDEKTLPVTTTANGSVRVEGSTTTFQTPTANSQLNLGGNFTLVSDAEMAINCFDNLQLVTTGDASQILYGGGRKLRFLSLESEKSDGGISLAGGPESNSLRLKTDLRLNYTGTAEFADNGDTLFVGDDVLISGLGATNFDLTGTLWMNGVGVDGDLRIANFAGTAAAVAPFNDVVVATGANVGPDKVVAIYPADGSGSITVKGNLEIVQGANSANLDAQNNTINLGGNWLSYGENGFIEGTTSRVIFDGTEAQSITVPTKVVFAHMTWANTNTMVMTQDIDITTNLTVSQGSIITGSNKITLSPTATISETDFNNVLGVVETTRNLSLANHAFGGLGIEIDADGNAPGSTFVRRTTGEEYSNVYGHVSILRKFTVVPTTNTGLNATMVYSYFDSELNSRSKGGLVLFRSTDGGAIWTMRGGNGNQFNNEISLSGINAFSEWTAAENELPLPLVMGNLIGKVAEGYAQLQWFATSENEVIKQMRLEKSMDGMTFELVKVMVENATVPALNYTFTDENFERSAYYRVAMEGNSGEVKFTNTVHLKTTGSLPSVIVMPNPTQSTFDLHFQELEREEWLEMQLTDLSGKVIYENHGPAYLMEQYFNRLSNNFPAGTFILDCHNVRFKQVLRLVKHH